MTKKKYDIQKGAPTVEEFMKKFKTNRDAYEFILKHIYPGGKVICPYCGCSDVIYENKGLLGRYTCGHCQRKNSVFNGTMFENTKKCYKNWLYIIYAGFISRKSISSIQLSRELDNSFHTILNFRRRIQVAMGNYDLEPFTGVIQMDEAYFGGSNHGRYSKEQEGIGQIKYPLFGIFETKTHRVYTCVAKQNEKGQCLTAKQIKDFIECTCQKGSTVVSDEWKSYKCLDAEDSGYKHKTVNHKEYKYKNEEGYTTNGIESYFGILKKIYYSTHAFFSKKWAHLYFAESDFRYNHTNWKEAIDTVLSQGVFFPRVIDIRLMGKFANKTYDLKKFKMILPKKFDDVDLADISVCDILTCDEPVYGILKEPYLSKKEQLAGRGNFTKEWKGLGFQEYMIDYKDYRKRVTNSAEDIETMIQEAIKYKDVNTRTEISKKNPSNRNKARRRQLTLQKSYNNLPKMIQVQIKSEYPNILKITDKELGWEVHNRIRVLKNWYNKNINFIENNIDKA